ncbi:Histidinol dehydrogenase [subsurface metagenome]
MNETDIKIEDLSSMDEEEIRHFFKEGKITFPRNIEQDVKRIIGDVANRGDEALLEHTKHFDSVDLSSCGIRITVNEIEACIGNYKEEFSRALDISIRRIRDFHEREVVKDWTYIDELGNTLGKKFTPIERVGIYIPGGKASYPSTLIMTAIPALVAGVKEIVLISPPSSFDAPSSLSLAITKIGNICDVYRVGGVQGIAALALGTHTIKKVDKIVGPGNIYVTLAKKELYGYVDIDMIAGPSEVLIISDGSVNPRLTAVDLLAQAEHDEHARAFCITTSLETALDVRAEVFKLLQIAQRKNIIEASMKNNGRIFVVKSENCAVSAANAIAPEHLEIQTEDPESLLSEIKNAGAIFLGKYTPEAFGDYLAGPSHVLPTHGTARFFSPLNVLSFVKFSSVINMSKKGIDELGRYASVFAETEGLAAHASSIYFREEED